MGGGAGWGVENHTNDVNIVYMCVSHVRSILTPPPPPADDFQDVFFNMPNKKYVTHLLKLLRKPAT